MPFRDKLALNVAPLMLRFALALAFVWAGASKIFHTDTVTGEDAAMLANLGVIAAPGAPVPPTSPTPLVPPATTPDSLPNTSNGTGTSGTDSAPIQSTDVPDASGGVTFTLPTPAVPPAGSMGSLRLSTAADFPNDVVVSRRHTSITLLLYKAAQPDAQGRQLWPASLSSPGVLRTLAWMAPLTEFAGGFLVLVGFLTRLSAISLAGTMVVAMLLTTVGPAALSGDAFLGFLPQPRLADSSAWIAAWTPLLFQFTLLMAAFALTLSGPGALSLDRLVFGSRAASGAAASGAEDEDDD